MGKQTVGKESATEDGDPGMPGTFAALGHPTRCEILHLLSAGDASASALAEHFDVSRPAISQHLGILVTCGLVLLRCEDSAHCDKFHAASLIRACATYSSTV